MAAPAVAVKAAKVAVSLLTTDKGRKTFGWIIVFLLSPIILVAILIFVFLQAGSRHNNDMLQYCFYGSDLPQYTPQDFNEYIQDMQYSFRLLDDQIALVNEQCEERKLDSVRIKSIFFSLYFGGETPSRRNHRSFVNCFYELEERMTEEEVEVEPPTDPPTFTMVEVPYEAAVPIQDLGAIYANLASTMGIGATEVQRTNAQEIYIRMAGHADGEYDYDPDAPFVGMDGFVSPVGPSWRAMVSDEYGWRSDPITGERAFHRGIDMHGATGHPIYSVLDGRVIAVGTDPDHSWGYYIKVDHGGGFVTVYAHNSTVLVAPGQQVTAGQQIAGMGATGRVTGVHLHFEIMINGELQNPRSYIP